MLVGYIYIYTCICNDYIITNRIKLDDADNYEEINNMGSPYSTCYHRMFLRPENEDL